MAQKKNRLGRGLNQMLGGNTSLDGLTNKSQAESSSIKEIALSLIDANKQQPRHEFDDAALDELAVSIKNLGLIQPITIQSLPSGRYKIISGERRYRAAKKAGLDKLPAYIREVKDEEVLELALVENIQREDLNPIEIALAYKELIEANGFTQEALAERVGKKRTTISNYMRLLRLPAAVQLGLSQRLLEMGHARALLQLEDTERLLELYELTINEHLSVREVEELAKAIKEESLNTPKLEQSKQAKVRQPEEFKILEKHLANVFASKVALTYSKNGKGQIKIPFTNEEDLERIIALLERIQQA